MSEPTLSYEDYTVGITCAFHEEMVAVEAALDEKHGMAQGTPGGNDADFSFGRIGEHNVVIGYPTDPMMAMLVTSHARSIATVARNMMRRFPIRIGLMVGIGSGVWSEQKDIRLGDLVVSGSDRVVQWERGRNSVFQKTGTLNKPPRLVLDAIQSLKLEEALESREVDVNLEALHKTNMVFSGRGPGSPGHEHENQGGHEAIAQFDYEKDEENELELREGERVYSIDMVDEDWWMGENSRGEKGLFPSNYVELVEGGGDAAPSPVQETDELFEASYEHVGGEECANCDRSRLVRNRPLRTNDGRPRVHYGTIASSNAVVKNGSTRDCIARDEGIICFETDAAGLMATFPCVMIRGICDYADSHRNRRWHLRAAAVAAAYAKVLLQSIPAADLAAERLASEACELQIVHIPFRRSPRFLGRRAELEFLERRIITAQDCQKLAVFGPSGMGKTQLVLGFAESVAEQHPDMSVFWMRAHSAEAFESDAAEVVRQLNLRSAAKVSGDAIDLVRRHFSAPSARRWLLIVEDVDDVETMDPSTRSTGLLRHLPESPLGATIFTTHSPNVARRLAGHDVLELKGLTEDAAAELLETTVLDRRLLKDPAANAKFLAELGNVPSAILEAAASINKPKLSISDFSSISRTRGLATTSAVDDRDQRVQRRHRRAPVPYAYPAADTSTVQYTFDGIDSPQTSPAPDGPLSSSPGARKPTRLQRIKPCYIMVALGFLAIGGSLAVGLYYSIAQDRMGDGFTTAGWMVAVSTLILAAPMAKHYPNCRCWDSHQYAVL